MMKACPKMMASAAPKPIVANTDDKKHWIWKWDSVSTTRLFLLLSQFSAAACLMALATWGAWMMLPPMQLLNLTFQAAFLVVGLMGVFNHHSQLQLMSMLLFTGWAIFGWAQLLRISVAVGEVGHSALCIPRVTAAECGLLEEILCAIVFTFTAITHTIQAVLMYKIWSATRRDERDNQRKNDKRIGSPRFVVSISGR